MSLKCGLTVKTQNISLSENMSYCLSLSLLILRDNGFGNNILHQVSIPNSTKFKVQF